MANWRLRPHLPDAIARALSSALLVLVCSGYALRPSPFVTGELAEAEHEDLRVGYALLADLLADTARGTSHALELALLGAPSPGLAEVIARLSDTSQKRATELSELRQQAPVVAASPARERAQSDAVSALAKDLRRSDMLSRDAAIDTRPVAARGRAVRMIATMARATARFDPNRERKAWLNALAVEYEGLLGELGRCLDPR